MLKHKHFNSLNLDIDYIQFPRFLSENGLHYILEMNEESNDAFGINEAGFFQFATLDDMGLICFDLRKVDVEEAEIVFIDEENLDVLHYADNFRELLTSTHEFGNYFIDRLNEYFNPDGIPE